MGTVIDLSNVEGGSSYDPLPANQYHVAVTDVEVKESGPNSKNPGSLYLAWEFTVQSGEFEGRKLWTNTSLLPQALFGLKGLIAACPNSGLDPNGTLDLEEVTSELMGQDVCAVVTLKTKPAEYAQYEGEKQNNIKAFKPMGQMKAGKSASMMP
jgi:hypothetical protein